MGMTGPKGNNGVLFLFSETLNVGTWRNIEVESLFPAGPVIKCVIPHNSKLGKKHSAKVVCSRPAATQICFRYWDFSAKYGTNFGVGNSFNNTFPLLSKKRSKT